jgi:Spy/CpxP family protein refolding chaperone
MHRKLAVTMILLFVLLSSAAAFAAPAKYEFHLPCADPFWGEGGI